jgi:phosphate uptake regulator
MYVTPAKAVARRLQAAGGSLAVTLPKQWVKVLNLKKGDTVLFEVRPDSLVLRTPGRQEPVSMITLRYPAGMLELLLNDLTGAYLRGYDIIEITGAVDIEPADRAVIRNAAKRLLGLEVIEEDARRIQMQVLADHISLNPQQVFWRMHIISKGMLTDAIVSLAQGNRELARLVVDRDEELDRFYFFMVRLLRRAASDPLLTSEYQMTAVELLDMRVAAHALENLGDAAVEICQGVEAGLTASTTEMRATLEQASILLQETQERAVRAFVRREGREAIEVFKNYGRLVSLIQPLVEGSPLPRGLVTAHRALTTAGRLLADIADLAAPLHE